MPAIDGPHPGVLFLCGHVDDAKADPDNQRACAELARNGFVVLAVDPVAQGERLQYRDPETGEAVVGGGGGVFAHSYAGQQCYYAGTNLARYMIHDARCGLDYLAGRPDIDDDRLGVTGTSGGGIQTEYLTMVDDRVDAAAPCCSVTDRREQVKTGKKQDAEQTVYGAISRGINFDDYLAAMAPGPVCVGAAASDEYFPVEGVREAVERVRAVYDFYGAAANVDLVVADETHCSVYELGDGVFEWFCETLGDDAYRSHDDLAVLDESALNCTPDGSVLAAFDGERTVTDLVAEYVREHYPDAGRDTGADDTATTDPDADADRLRRTLAEAFDLDREGCELHPRYVAESRYDGLDVEHVWFRTERDPDVVVTGVLVSDPDADPESPAIVLYEDGTEELPERRDDAVALADEHGAVLVFDPRGVGAVQNRRIPIPAWAENDYGVYGTEFKFASDALQLGTSLFGMRVFDALRAAEFLRAAVGGEAVTFVGEGVGAYHALYAAGAAERASAVDLRDLGPSFREMATSREYPYDARLTAFDVVGDCDVPRVLAALDDRDVRVERRGD